MVQQPRDGERDGDEQRGAPQEGEEHVTKVIGRRGRAGVRQAGAGIGNCSQRGQGTADTAAEFPDEVAGAFQLDGILGGEQGGDDAVSCSSRHHAFVPRGKVGWLPS